MHLGENVVQLEIFSDIKNVLGEGPCWSEYGFAWVDILGRKLWLQDDNGAREVFSSETEMPSSVAFDDKGDLIFTLNDGFYRVVDGELKLVRVLEGAGQGIRFNDGKIDSQGRYWAGTMDMAEVEPKGSLYVLEGDDLIRVLDGITTSNGLCWDGNIVYYIDSPTKQIKKYYYDADALTLIGGDVVYTVEETDVYPDGMCIDDEGKIWLALWNGFKVLRIDPDSGGVLQDIDVPCKKVTSCCFGGAKRDELYITTASKDMNESDWIKHPNSGKIFRCKPGVTGPLLNKFRQ